MSYDADFDQIRLDQLAAQCLANSSVQGKLIFLSDSEDNRLDVASFQLKNDHDLDALTECGFKHYLMELLDTLLMYRAQHNQPNSSQGVIYIDRNRLELEWLSREEAEKLRELENDT